MDQNFNEESFDEAAFRHGSLIIQKKNRSFLDKYKKTFDDFKKDKIMEKTLIESI